MIVATGRAAATAVYWNCAKAMHQPHSEQECKHGRDMMATLASGLFNSDNARLTSAAKRDMALSTSQTAGQPCEIINLATRRKA